MSDKLLRRFKQMKKLKVFTLIQLLIAVMMLVSSLSSRVVFGDPISTYPPLYIEGARIVSEGAYFRFWIRNGGNDPVYLTVNNDTLHIPSLESIDYNVIAPEVSLPYEKATYTFKLRFNISETASLDIKYTVLVLDSSFLTIFDLVVPIHIAAVMLIIGTTFYFTRRRYLLHKTGDARVERFKN